MKKRVVLFLAVLLLLASVCWPVARARAAIMAAAGSCFMTPIGKSINYGGTTSSAQDEDVIRVTVILKEQRNGTWQEIARISKELEDTDYVSTSDTVTVSGGHYYKVFSTHYTKTGTVESTSSGHTSSYWIDS